MRIKLRQSQSTIPIEKVPLDSVSLEIIGVSLEKIPSLIHLEKLKSLSIFAENLSELSELPNRIEILKLRSMKLTQLDLDKVSKQKQVRILELIDTKISILPENFFNELEKLETLSLKGNQLENLPSLKSSSNLTRINMDNNHLKTIPNSIREHKALNHLSLDNNNFSEEEKNKIFKLFGIWF